MNGKDKITKMNNMEIKVGDKVRVREDAPSMFRSGFNHVYTAYISKVLEVDDGNAIIEMTMANMQCQERIIIPTKYLVKVDAEKKEAKFKVGDVVRLKDIYYKEELRGRIGTIRKIAGCHIYVEVDSTIYPAIVHSIEPYTEPTAATIKVGDKVEELVSRKSGRVLRIEGDFVVVGIPYDKEKHYWHIDSVELIEPTEQTEVQKNDSDNFKKVAEEWANTVSDAIKEYGDAMCQTYIDAHNEAYWDAYAADLAKELALKVANKYNDPKEAAEYAVLVAKAVVEGLKRK